MYLNKKEKYTIRKTSKSLFFSLFPQNLKIKCLLNKIIIVINKIRKFKILINS